MEYILIWIANFVEHLVSSRESLAATGLRTRLWMAAARGRSGPVGTLPDDDSILADLAFCTVQEVRAEKKALVKTWDLVDGRFHIRRIEEQYEKCQADSERGRAAADARWSKHRPTQRRLVMRTQPAPEMSQEQRDFEELWRTGPKHGIKKSVARVLYDGFVECRKLYPHHRCTKRRKEWGAWLKMRPPVAEVKATLAWKTRSVDWTKDGGKYVPGFEAWLNAGGWEQEQTGSATAEPKGYEALRSLAERMQGEGGGGK